MMHLVNVLTEADSTVNRGWGEAVGAVLGFVEGHKWKTSTSTPEYR